MKEAVEGVQQFFERNQNVDLNIYDGASQATTELEDFRVKGQDVTKTLSGSIFPTKTNH